MLLAVDIGNTNITLALFKGSAIAKSFTIPAKAYARAKLKKILNGHRIRDAIVSSVVPAATKRLGSDLRAALGKDILILGKNIRVPIKNLYRNPRQVGQDRLIGAYAASILYGSPAIVVDFGTAITFDIISRNKEYMGGMILPGLELSLTALNERTALLPKIKLKSPKEFIGRDTKNSMLSGLVYGVSCMTDSLTQRLKEKIGRSAPVIATGGNSRLIFRFSKCIDIVDENLVLKGLFMLYNSWIR